MIILIFSKICILNKIKFEMQIINWFIISYLYIFKQFTCNDSMIFNLKKFLEGIII